MADNEDWKELAARVRIYTRAETLAKHTPTECGRTDAHMHYTTKNWTAEFECPACTRRGRFNLNFLGRRKVICDGLRFTREER